MRDAGIVEGVLCPATTGGRATSCAGLGCAIKLCMMGMASVSTLYVALALALALAIPLTLAKSLALALPDRGWSAGGWSHQRWRSWRGARGL